MATVTSNKKITGHVLGVSFTDGTGETDSPAALAYFERSDEYTIEKKAAKKAADSTPAA